MREHKAFVLIDNTQGDVDIICTDPLFVGLHEPLSGVFEGNDLIVSNVDESVCLPNVFQGVWAPNYRLVYAPDKLHQRRVIPISI